MGHALGNNYGKQYSFGSKPVLLDMSFTVDSSSPTGVSNLRGQGVKAVFMSSESPSGDNPMVDDVSDGYIQVELEYNYPFLFGYFADLTGPQTGSDLAIDTTALTAGTPYQITDPGVGTPGETTIQTVADSSGSLAGTWFSLYDSYGNTFIVWFSVSGVGVAPKGTGGILVQQSIATNDTDATIATALATTIGALPSGISGVSSFTATPSTNTVTVDSTTDTPLAGPAAEGANPTGFTFALTAYTTNLSDWQHVGLPPGVLPVIGATFVATATGYSTGGGSSGTVKALAPSGISHVETVGNPNFSLAPIPMGGSPHTGGIIILQCLAPTPNTSAMDFPYVPTAPADGTQINLTFYLEQASRVGGNNE